MGKGVFVVATGIGAVLLGGCQSPWSAALFGRSTYRHPTPAPTQPAPTQPGTATTAPPPTVPATTAPATAGPLPTVDTMPYATYTAAVKPKTIYLSGDSTNIVDNLRWAGWDSHGATGYGTVDIEGCVPNCAQGSQTATPVTVYLNDPVHGAFSLLTEDIQGRPAQNFTLPTGTPLPTVDTMPLTGSYSPAVKPATIYLSGDSGNIVTGLRWAGWDSRGATGYGTVDIQGCVPDCAQGSETPTPVTIYLNNPVHGAFSLLTEDIQGRPSQNFTLPTG